MPAIQILDGRTSVWQWDTGVKIKLYGCNDVDQMHFETPDGLISRAVVDDECSVPDSALQTAGMLKMYAYDRNEAGGITRNDFTLWIRARPKPADYVDSPDEVDNLDELAKRVAQLIPCGGGEPVTPEQIQQAVDSYLDKNPVQIEETDPTVPNWAKQPEKPGYTPEEVGAQPKGDYALKSDVPAVPVKSVNGKTGEVKLSASDVDALPANAEIVDATARAGVAENEQKVAELTQEMVKSINGVTPDANGNVSVEVGSDVSIDATLTKEGQAADAKQTGNKINGLAGEIAQLKEPVKVVGTNIGTKCAKFAELFNGTDKVESFIFFTDPHLTGGRSGYESQMRSYLKTLKTYYDATPTNFVVCGGDWLGNADTINEACFKLGFINGTMRSLVEPYYPVVGNHDTNYQGKSTAESTELDGTLTNETIRNLFVPGEQSNYYSFDGTNTRFYVLDTGIDWGGETMDDYRWEQVAWLADKLVTDDKPYSAIFLHIGKAALAQNVYSLCQAYNSATTIVLNGVTYDFTDCTGRVKYAIAGHTHADAVEVISGIILVTTTQMRDGNTPTFDLCLANYDNDVLHLVRVGSGAGRTISLVDGSYTEQEDSDSGEDEAPGLPVTSDQIAGTTFLPRVTTTGYKAYVSTKRAIMVTTVNAGGMPSPFGEHDGYTPPAGGPYYPFAIPDGATKIRVECDGLEWQSTWFNTEPKYIGMRPTSGWAQSGDEADVYSKATHVWFNFHFPNEAVFAENYDSSHVKVTFI